MPAASGRHSTLPAVRPAVVVATKGRPQATTQLLRLLEQQTLLPSMVLISATDPLDVELPLNTPLNVEYIFGPAGLTAQRNRALNEVRGRCDVVIFFDDDFAPCRSWIENCVRILGAEGDAVGFSGLVLRDGAQADQISWEEAKRLIDEREPGAAAAPVFSPCTVLYGCNMAFRSSAVADANFDERLVLYGWLEDTDFSRTVAKRGRLLQCDSMVGVHLGIKGGRVSGKRYGYSQVVNAWYLYKKGTISSREVWPQIFKALLANGLKSFRPEKYIDRLGRFHGNLVGVCHLLSGSCRPERAAEL
jgi:glycosyltransferase involved in cell wall biosynthesis